MNVIEFPKRVTIRALMFDNGDPFDEFMFEQVIDADIVDRQTMVLRGTGIGYVNLMIDWPPDVAINLFWKFDGKPRRCIVYRRADPAMERGDEYEALVAPLFDLPHLYVAVGSGDSL
jgi:hypothetical protein